MKSREFNADLWEGMIQRIRQMVITNGNEHKINWNVSAESNHQKFIKSVANLVVMRGEKIYDERPTLEKEYFGL